MLKKEWGPIFAIAILMAFRMLGLFMILPVFSVQASQFQGHTPTLVGLTLGIYGLTQALLQIPFGLTSDYIGRKPVITFGLILFALGSILAANAHSIYGLLWGRAIQGSGAIGSTCLALLTDVSRDENRTKAMAVVGMMIGLSFALAVIIGPIINTYFQLSGIFWLTAMLATIALVLLYTMIPNPPAICHKHKQTLLQRYQAVFHNTQLIRLNFGIFSQHAIMTSLFIGLPIILTHTLQRSDHQQTLLYLITLVIAFFSSIPIIIVAEKKRKMKSIFIIAITCIAFSQGIIITSTHSLIGLTLTLLIFFSAFTALEACLPSLVSKIAPIHNKGAAMGIYSSCQFLGIFVGGCAGGWCYGQLGLKGLFLSNMILALLWLCSTITMQPPPYLSTVLIKAPNNNTIDDDWLEKIQSMPGIAEAAYLAEEQLLHIKVDKQKTNINGLRQQLEAGTLS